MFSNNLCKFLGYILLKALPRNPLLPHLFSLVHVFIIPFFLLTSSAKALFFFFLSLLPFSYFLPFLKFISAFSLHSSLRRRSFYFLYIFEFRFSRFFILCFLFRFWSLLASPLPRPYSALLHLIILGFLSCRPVSPAFPFLQS